MKPVPAPAMPRFRLPLVAAALLLSSVLFPGEAGAEWGLEITPYVGYAIGGSFTDNATGADLDVQEGGSYGLVLDLPDTRKPSTNFSTGSSGRRSPAGDVRGRNPLRPGHPLPSPGGTYLFTGRRSAPSFPGGSAQRTLCRMGAGWTGKRTSPSRWAGA